jgi:hypothetical protein
MIISNVMRVTGRDFQHPAAEFPGRGRIEELQLEADEKNGQVTGFSEYLLVGEQSSNWNANDI